MYLDIFAGVILVSEKRAENALREKVPGVTIPYWDSTLDSHLYDPRASVIWSERYLGNGNGRVKTGPFANWVTPTGPLMRNFGDGGTMMNWTSLRQTFSRKYYAEIVNPTGEAKYVVEASHNEPHLWIGGYMAPVTLAGYDVAFFVHHSFIDLVWEIFRRLQKRQGVDPTMDYPVNFTGPPGHGFDDPSGIGTLLNRHALSDIFTSEIYTYTLPPTCTRGQPTCGSNDIRCDTSGPRPKCVSATVFDTPANEVFDATSRRKRSLRKPQMTNNTQSPVFLPRTPAELQCSLENVNDHYINTFILDGVTNKHGWSYIPVNIIVRRKPQDLSKVAAYPKCKDGSHRPLRVFVESNGISYMGFYKEIAHVEDNVLMSSAVTYVGVKSPTETPVEVTISAYDSCGRICRPFCKSGNGKHFRACSGAVRIHQDLPKQYSVSVSTMSAMLWQEDMSGLPTMDDEQMFMKVVCDENISWPWVK